MASKQYEVVRPFSRTDPRTGVDTHFDVGDVFPGPVDKPYFMDVRGPDGKGPLIAEKPAPADSASKEK